MEKSIPDKSAQESSLPGAPQITLFLMTVKGYEFLKGKSSKYKILFNQVVVGNDKNIKNDFEDEIISFCIKENINWVRRKDFIKITTEFCISVSWRWLIEHPSEKLIIFHDSLLPKYRGFAPLVNALINGEKEIGVTAIFGASQFDSGDIIAQSKSYINYPMTIDQAVNLNHKNYMNCAEIVLSKLLYGQELAASRQLEVEASYSVWRDETDYMIDWKNSSSYIRRFIDAVGFPYKGASTFYEGKLVRIFKAEESFDVSIENRHYGKVLFIIDEKPVVICGEGMLRLIVANIEEDGKLVSFLPLPRFRARFT